VCGAGKDLKLVENALESFRGRLTHWVNLENKSTSEILGFEGAKKRTLTKPVERKRLSCTDKDT